MRRARRLSQTSPRLFDASPLPEIAFWNSIQLTSQSKKSCQMPCRPVARYWLPNYRFPVARVRVRVEKLPLFGGDRKFRIPGLPLRSRRARRVLKSRAALMLAQRAPGETAFGCVHQPTSMAAGLATRELAGDRTFAEVASPVARTIASSAAKTWIAVFGSRLPVGSSASDRPGPLASVRKSVTHPRLRGAAAQWLR
jgi:hypothetical protein